MANNDLGIGMYSTLPSIVVKSAGGVGLYSRIGIHTDTPSYGVDIATMVSHELIIIRLLFSPNN